MAIRSLIKNKNFIAGVAIGFTLTLGRVYIPILDMAFSPLLLFWRMPKGFPFEFISLYLSGLVIFVIYRVIFPQDSFKNAIKFFSIGILIPYALYLILVLIAVSQFNFTQ